MTVPVGSGGIAPGHDRRRARFIRNDIVAELDYSPWIVATRVRRCAAFLNSQRYIPCHVPNANFPPEIGIETVDPANTALICAGYDQIPPRNKKRGDGGGGYHIIASLCGVPILDVFGGEFVEGVNHIFPDVGIPISTSIIWVQGGSILVDGERCGGVLDE
jgi:hypothetical protein